MFKKKQIGNFPGFSLCSRGSRSLMGEGGWREQSMARGKGEVTGMLLGGVEPKLEGSCPTSLQMGV